MNSILYQNFTHDVTIKINNYKSQTFWGDLKWNLIINKGIPILRKHSKPNDLKNVTLLYLIRKNWKLQKNEFNLIKIESY